MLRTPRLSTAFVYPVVDWFIPAALKEDVELVQRVRMFVISHLFGPFLGHPITAFLYIVDPNPNPHVPILGISIAAFWLFPWALKFTGRYQTLALISVQNLTFATLWGSYHYGGVSSPFLPWLLMVPLLAFYYMGPGKSARIGVIGMLCVNLSLFYFAYSWDHSFPAHVPLDDMVGVGMISIFCAAIYVSMMAVYYANVVASQSELQREVLRHKITMAELREAKEAAERANGAKSDFLAKMSHELRTPLNAVIGYSEMLLEDAELSGNGESIADLEKINRAGKHLLALVTEVLDLSKIEAGKMELYIERFDLSAFIDDIASTCRPLIAKNANELVVNRTSDLGVVACDVTKLRQAVINLLSNAGKFTKNGRVTLETGRHQDENGEYFTISVHDTGIGIRAEDLGRLFQNFSQADANISGQFGGTGLGLALSRKLCRIMDGDITVASEFGAGSTFTIRLPVTAEAFSGLPSDAAGEAVPVRQAAEGKSVLVIDDDPDVLELMQRILEGEGFESILVDNAESGLQLARTMKPALIVLDVVMPGMDGWQLLSALKSDESLKACPVIVQSILDDPKTGYELGADEVLSKPIDRKALTENLVRLCRREPDAAVLVVSSSADMFVSAVVDQLRRQRVPVVEAADCETALLRATAVRPAAVLLGNHVSRGMVLKFLDSLRQMNDEVALPVLAVYGDNGQAEEAPEGVTKIVGGDTEQAENVANQMRELMTGAKGNLNG